MTSRTIPASTSRSDRRALLRSLVGKPYRIGGDGPDSFDCYGLVRFVLREVYGVEIPASRFAALSRRAWRRVPQPLDGALMLMGVHEKHVGVFVAGGCLHAMSNEGVVFDDLLSLRFRGLGRIRMYVPE